MPLNPAQSEDSTLVTRATPLPYARQTIDEADIAAVVDTLRSPYLTTGPRVREFEASLQAEVGVEHAVAVSNGTAALHAAMHALGIGQGDQVILPPMTFAATANAVVFQGATPRFVDVDADTLLLDPAALEDAINSNTRAIVAVDYAGQPCDYDAIRTVAAKHRLPIVADACHALGGECHGRKVGTLADISTFSFHPVKPITTCEGGMCVTSDQRLADRMRQFRNHGILGDHHERARRGTWQYEMTDIGYNYRLSDVHAALGTSQLRKLAKWQQRRQAIAAIYDAAIGEIDGVTPIAMRAGVIHAYHLYVVRIDADRFGVSRDDVFAAMRERNICCNVHYLPVHLHPFYRERLGTRPGTCPNAELAGEQILSLPMFAAMTDGDVEDVIAALRQIATEARR
ncbi:MAG: UDP-4-amino-4,6-dideoxy-N-acetyl-beta-L-altrosamine transaminase [Phycisphaerae bacterium]